MTTPNLGLNGRNGSVNLSLIFNERLLKIDKEVAKFLGMSGMAPLSFVEPQNFYADWLEHPPKGELSEVDPNTVLGILSFLDSAETSSEILAIPEGEDELNLIFGIIVVDGERRVLYLEHEHEASAEEEYHLHSRSEGDYMVKKKANRFYLTRTF